MQHATLVHLLFVCASTVWLSLSHTHTHPQAPAGTATKTVACTCGYATRMDVGLLTRSVGSVEAEFLGSISLLCSNGDYRPDSGLGSGPPDVVTAAVRGGAACLREGAESGRRWLPAWEALPAACQRPLLVVHAPTRTIHPALPWPAPTMPCCSATPPRWLAAVRWRGPAPPPPSALRPSRAWSWALALVKQVMAQCRAARERLARHGTSAAALTMSLERAYWPCPHPANSACHEHALAWAAWQSEPRAAAALTAPRAAARVPCRHLGRPWRNRD